MYHHAMGYRGYELEQKTLIVGCQVIITKNDAFVRNGSILKEMKDAIAEAQAYIDSLMDPAP
ncbi:MAG TPA: hypothetical protein VFQ52_01585 [Rhizomicrobium sp.]|nr:hypothetical protein [Rhizomicrobium sp.]